MRKKILYSKKNKLLEKFKIGSCHADHLGLTLVGEMTRGARHDWNSVCHCTVKTFS